jgi:hypothetical protein
MRLRTGTRAWHGTAVRRLAAVVAVVVGGTLAAAGCSGTAGSGTALAPAGATATAGAAAGSAAAGSTRIPGTGTPGTGTPARATPGSVTPGSTTPGSGAGTTPGSTAAATAAPAYFHTIPPGEPLPSGAQCAQWVRERPAPENKAANARDNHITGEGVGPDFFAAGDSPLADRLLAPRINGDFTGTTQEILRWAACKWGIDQDVVFAQAAVESWWQQDALGDWGTDASACPPGHQPGADGKPGQCPQSYGILQNRYPYEPASWPGIGDSTAMNADTAYAIWRSCYDGYETWLNTVPRGQQYAKGDLWGCVGRWFAGRWHTAPAQQYIARVQQYLTERIWLTKDFQQG